jgi:hypothetical protein
MRRVYFPKFPKRVRPPPGEIPNFQKRVRPPPGEPDVFGRQVAGTRIHGQTDTERYARQRRFNAIKQNEEPVPLESRHRLGVFRVASTA